MPNLKAIRKRIATVKNTRKITRAMKLVAAARLRKAQENITRMRPYALQTMDMIASLAARAGDDEELHPLLARREPKRVLFVVLTSDRGLAGAFNSGVSKAAHRAYTEIRSANTTVELAMIGRKGADYFKRRNIPINKSFHNMWEQLSYRKAEEIGDYIVEEYTTKGLDAAYLCYNEFKSAITQKVVVEKILPIEPVKTATNEDNAVDYIYEPDQRTILNTILPLYVNVEIYRALLESVASEHGARMTAMDNATNNAADMIKRLTLQANRARQAAITTELMEIIGGAEALKG
ncbi:MAG TPA: ATP synthase F1 subunit gamma [Polyangiales bacterium]|nr:ATP synthase F1 subunit gamma [Polyangiales bacterium]